MPEHFTQSSERKEHNFDHQSSFKPIGSLNSITNRQSTTTAGITGLQGTNKRNVKVSISKYPKFSGQAKDWNAYESKFLSVASSQDFEHIFQDEEFEQVILRMKDKVTRWI